MTSTPTKAQAAAPAAERIRLTISVAPEVHAAFSRLAAVSNSSIGREMGDFLAETVDAVQFIAGKMEEARSAPGRVVREMHAYALGLADETGDLLRKMKAPSRPAVESAAPADRPAGGRRGGPPSSNTGGKGAPKGGGKPRGARS